MDIDIARFSDCRLLVIGDLMMDEYLWGQVERISPEAPVQVVAVEKEEFTLGGAGNVVNNLIALGARVAVAGVIGTAADGVLMREIFINLGVDIEGVIDDPDRPTTRKTRVIAASQHVLRIDRETRTAIAGNTLDRLAKVLARKISDADVVLISDYGKGVLTPGILRLVIDRCRELGKKLVADPKGLDFGKYSGVSVLTPNQKEAAAAAGIEITDDVSLLTAGKKILAAASLETLLVTRGKDGMAILYPDRSPHMIKSVARQVYDVSGAGDTVLSVLALALATGAGIEQAAGLANSAAGIVVGKVGTATVSSQELAAALSPAREPEAFKFKRPDELPGLIREQKRAGKKIVLTNGCFDLLHAGHIRLFTDSRRMGDLLIVAIDDDAAVRALKGPGRPIIKVQDRIRILSALDCVDVVVVYGRGELEALIEVVQPDILTKGGNYADDQVRGRELVAKHGGRVALIPIEEKQSSSQIIKAIQTGISKEPQTDG